MLRGGGPRVHKLDADPSLRTKVIARLRAEYSPDQVAGSLRHERPAEQARWVSHERIDTWIYDVPTGDRHVMIKVTRKTFPGTDTSDQRIARDGH